MSEQLERLIRHYKAEYGVNYQTISDIVGCSTVQLAEKRKGRREFTVREAVNLLDMLNAMLEENNEGMTFDELFAILPEINRAGTWAEGYKTKKPKHVKAIYHRLDDGSFVRKKN